MGSPGEEITGAVESIDARLRFEIRNRDPYRVALEFDARNLLSRYEVVGPDGSLLQVRYDDYREVAGIRFAHRVELDFPISAVHAEIQFRGVELNPSLPEGIFRLEKAQ